MTCVSARLVLNKYQGAVARDGRTSPVVWGLAFESQCSCVVSCLNAYPQYACFDTCTRTLDASCVYGRVYGTHIHMHLHVRIHAYRERET